MSRIVLAMSGGVDSSVAAHLLCEAGHDVIGVFMRHGEEAQEVCAAGGEPGYRLPIFNPRADHKQGCCSASDAEDARRVADRLRIPFYALNLQAEFRQIISKPNGIILVTGPTGAGKTTTLYSALNELNVVTDKIITTFATVGYAIPSFLLAIYVWYIGGIILRDITGSLLGFEFGFPLFGRQSLGSDGDPLDIAFHLVLPVTALAIQSIAAFSRYLRASMLDVMRQDYVRTAKAKGASSSRVIGRHALRNALIPLITLIGLSIPGLIAGAVITEFIFSYPGIGQLTITAIFQNDYPTIYATSMLVGIFVIVGNLVADILYGVVDPRIKY